MLTMQPLLAAVVTALATAPADESATGQQCPFEIHNKSGCTAAGHYEVHTVAAPAACCGLCVAQSDCMSWSFHAGASACYLSAKPKIATSGGTADTTCGCRFPHCFAPPTPPPAPVACVPVQRPAKPARVPLPQGKSQPHIVTILVDDLGFADASIRGDVQSFSDCPGKGCVTPHLMELRKEGILLDRHHTYLWCSPTRRAFLTGRYPVHVTGTQAPTCSNWTPLQFTILSEKLAAVDYEAHFIGTCWVLLLSLCAH